MADVISTSDSGGSNRAVAIIAILAVVVLAILAFTMLSVRHHVGRRHERRGQQRRAGQREQQRRRPIQRRLLKASGADLSSRPPASPYSSAPFFIRRYGSRKNVTPQRS
jgi:hypothetical protein